MAIMVTITASTFCMDHWFSPSRCLSQPRRRLSPQNTTMGTPRKQSSRPTISTQMKVLNMVRPNSVASRTMRRKLRRFFRLRSNSLILGVVDWARLKISASLKLQAKAQLMMPALSLKSLLKSRNTDGKGNQEASSRIS